MKAELTPELKEKFFALYWYQEVMMGIKGELRETSPALATFNQTHLILRPLDQITDEEAIEVSKTIRPNSEWLHEAKYSKSFMKDLALTSCTFPIHSAVADYLRSRGFAIGFMGHSVEDLVSAGWIKLTNPPA